MGHQFVTNIHTGESEDTEHKRRPLLPEQIVLAKDPQRTGKGTKILEGGAHVLLMPKSKQFLSQRL